MACLVSLLACAVAALAASNDTFFIHDADVYPVTGPMMQGVSVLVQDGKIADIGAKIVPPKGIRVVEAKGLRVYPGMIDSATELGLQEIESVRETEDTGEIGEFMPQLRALAAVNPASEHFPVVRVNGITSVMTFPSSGAAGAGGGGGGRFGGGERQFISGQAALIHTDGWTWDDMAIKPNAAVHLIFPAMPRGGRGGAFNPEAAAPAAAAPGGTAAAKQAYDAQIVQINQFFDDARNYQKAKTANMPGFRSNLKFEAMIPVLEGKTPLAVTASRASAIHDAIQFAAKQNVKIVILEPRDLKQAAPELKEKNIPVILPRVLALPEYEDDQYDAASLLPLIAYKAGVKFALGTFGNEFVRNLPYEAAAATAYGLPYDEALKAITINAAEIWGVADQIGSVEKGKWADLMIANGDPLEIQTQISHLYMKGKEVELTNRQIDLYHKYMARP